MRIILHNMNLSCKSSILQFLGIVFVIQFLLYGCGRVTKTSSKTISEGNLIRKWTGAKWEEVSEWMSSETEFYWEDSFIDYDSDGDEVFSVSFTDAWGSSGLLMKYDTVTFQLENHTDNILCVSQFPSCADGIDIDGPFDLSNVVLPDRIKYFFWNSGSTHQRWNYTKSLPRLGSESSLEQLELIYPIPPMIDRGEIPLIDVLEFSSLKCLQRISIEASCPIVNLESILCGNNIKYAHIQVVLDRSDYFKEENNDDENWPFGEAENVIMKVDDDNFDELRQTDFNGSPYISLNINLTKLAHFSIEPLLNGKSRRIIYIASKNCIIDGLDMLGKISNLQKLESLCIEMNLGKRD